MTALFDLDGTLTDSAPGIVNSIRHALANGLPCVGVLWGYGSAAELAAATRLVRTPQELADELVALGG